MGTGDQNPDWHCEPGGLEQAAIARGGWNMDDHLDKSQGRIWVSENESGNTRGHKVSKAIRKHKGPSWSLEPGRGRQEPG